MSDQLPPAGWHPDPHGSARYRYWDGRNWTDHYAPMHGAAPTTPTAPKPSAAPAAPDASAQHRADASSPEVRAGGFGPAIDWVKGHKVWASVIGVFAFLILVGVIGSAVDPTDPSTTAFTDTTSERDAEPIGEPEPADEPTSEPAAPAVELPDDEADFISIVEGASESIASDANELQVVQAKTKRGTDMCALLGPSLAVSNWVGTVEDVSTELGGDMGVFAVTISDTIAVQTSNNSLSDIGSNTLIDPSSPLFNTISGFTAGDTVVFSGSFISGDKCLEEQSLVDLSGLRTPDFTFRFTSVEEK